MIVGSLDECQIRSNDNSKEDKRAMENKINDGLFCGSQ